MKDCCNCKNHTWGNEWWKCTPECIRCKYTDVDGEKVPSNWKPLPMTNADRIRAMSDDELAELFHGFCDNGERCVYCPLYEKSCAGVHSDVPKWLEWLQQPAEGECP